MKQRNRTRAVAAGIATVAATTLMAFGGGSATAGGGGTSYYLSETKNTFVSFAIGSGSDRVTELGYTARRLRCDSGRPQTGISVPGNGSAPIQSGLGGTYFEAFFVPGAPGWGGIGGKIGANRVKGSLFLQSTRKVDGKRVWCRTGTRKWTAELVSEDAWLAARAEQGYVED